jgi:hypothetical protein
MEKISDIFNSIKDRVNNPIFISFIISWIFCNWKVTIALLWYNSEYWDSQNNLSDYIIENTNAKDSIVIPIVFAIVYVAFVNPLAKNIVKILTQLIDNLGNFLHEKLIEDQPIKFRVYLEQTKELQERENAIATIQNKQDITNKRIKFLEDELRQLQDTVVQKDGMLEEQRKANSQQLELHEMEKQNLINKKHLQTDISFMQGTWDITYKNKQSDPKTIFIDPFEVRYMASETIYFYKPRAFLRTDNGHVFMIMRSNGDGETYFYDLMMNPDGSLSGFENDRAVIFDKSKRDSSVLWKK